MTEKELIHQINQLMHQGFELPFEKLVPEARFKEDLNLDSLDAVDMLVHLEEKLGTRIEGERLMHIKTLSDIYTLVNETVLAKQQVQNGELSP